MKIVKACLTAMLAVLGVGMANATPLNSSSRAVVPADLQQLISVDYRALRDSPTAIALKQQIMASQQSLQEFEGALKGVGVNPDKDIDTLSLPSFRTAKQGIRIIGIATGPFNMKAVIKKMALRKIKPTKYHNADLYPMEGGFVMTFLDDSTLLFGEPSAVKLGLQTRDGEILNLDSNAIMAEMMTSVDSAPFWSILDQAGAQNMDFSSGVNFDLTVVTSDSITAGTLSMMMKAVIMYKKSSATPVEKAAMDMATADSDGTKFMVHFKDNDAQFQALMHSPFFASISH
jgi:hypothetical protein